MRIASILFLISLAACAAGATRQSATTTYTYDNGVYPKVTSSVTTTASGESVGLAMPFPAPWGMPNGVGGNVIPSVQCAAGQTQHCAERITVIERRATNPVLATATPSVLGTTAAPAPTTTVDVTKLVQQVNEIQQAQAVHTGVIESLVDDDCKSHHDNPELIKDPERRKKILASCKKN